MLLTKISFTSEATQGEVTTSIHAREGALTVSLLPADARTAPDLAVRRAPRSWQSQSSVTPSVAGAARRETGIKFCREVQGFGVLFLGSWSPGNNNTWHFYATRFH